MFVEQFMFFYNDAKTKNQKYVYEFYNFSIFFSFIVGLGRVKRGRRGRRVRGGATTSG